MNAIAVPCKQPGTAKLLPVGLVAVLVGRERSPGPTWKSANWRRLENPWDSYFKRSFNGNCTKLLKWPILEHALLHLLSQLSVPYEFTLIST